MFSNIMYHIVNLTKFPTAVLLLTLRNNQDAMIATILFKYSHFIKRVVYTTPQSPLCINNIFPGNARTFSSAVPHMSSKNKRVTYYVFAVCPNPL